MQNNGLKYGLLGGLAIVLYLVGIYFVNPSYVTRSLPTYWVPLLVIYPPLMFKAALDEVEQKGKMDFRNLQRTPFLTFAIANVFFWVCLYALHMADPELVRMELGQQLAYYQDQLKQGMGDPQQMNKIRQQVTDIQAEIQKANQPVGPFVVYMAFWNLFGFAIAAAITAWVRSR